MNSGDKSLEDGRGVATKAFPCISLIVPSHFYRFYWSIEEDVSIASGIARIVQRDLPVKDNFVISKWYVVSWKGGADINININYNYL